jgi:hypothetical protein
VVHFAPDFRPGKGKKQNWSEANITKLGTVYGRYLTTKAWLSGYKIRYQSGQIAKSVATPIRPFLRSEKSS